MRECMDVLVSFKGDAQKASEFLSPFGSTKGVTIKDENRANDIKTAASLPDQGGAFHQAIKTARRIQKNPGKLEIPVGAKLVNIESEEEEKPQVLLTKNTNLEHAQKPPKNLKPLPEKSSLNGPHCPKVYRLLTRKTRCRQLHKSL